MPRFAAILASLLLIASSIGVNVARYPMVGEMVGGLEDLQASRAGADHHAPKATETTVATAGGQCPAYGCQRPEQPDLRPERQAQPDLRPGPLVPVILSGWEKGPAELSAADGEVRRLPPVERLAPPSSAAAALSAYPAMANYPRTAIP